MKNRRVVSLSLYLVVAAWMLVIFAFSSNPHDASSAQSEGIVNGVSQVFGLSIPEWAIRKSAHAFLYLVLGILVTIALFPHRLSWRQHLIVAAVVICIYALSDELHQLFVPGRAGLWSDVVIDGVSGLLGIALTLLVARRVIARKQLSLADRTDTMS